MSAREFRQAVRDAYKTCGSLQCASLQMQVHEADDSGLQPLPTNVMNGLDDVAFDLAQIWGDTILEGDYEAEESIQLERIEVVHIRGELAGFRITYSAKAFDHANKISGLIRESGFTTADGVKSFVDPEGRAQFLPAQN